MRSLDVARDDYASFTLAPLFRHYFANCAIGGISSRRKRNTRSRGLVSRRARKCSFSKNREARAECSGLAALGKIRIIFVQQLQVRTASRRSSLTTPNAHPVLLSLSSSSAGSFGNICCSACNVENARRATSARHWN